MAVLCAELQEAGRAGNLSGAPELVDLLAAEFERVDAQLSDEMAALDPPDRRP